MQEYISSLAVRLLKRVEMLSRRRETILKAIVEQYINKAKPVSSQSLINDYDLEVSSATIRNEMAYLEEAGFITHPHTSSGKVPGELGYRYYVQSIGNVQLPIDERLQISHIFHQAEREIEEWLNITASLVSQMVQNAVVVTLPRVNSGVCRLKHIELVGLTDTMALMVLVLEGATVRSNL
jgi:heat-inducible transcriptional repressor